MVSPALNPAQQRWQGDDGIDHFGRGQFQDLLAQGFESVGNRVFRFQGCIRVLGADCLQPGV